MNSRDDHSHGPAPQCASSFAAAGAPTPITYENPRRSLPKPSPRWAGRSFASQTSCALDAELQEARALCAGAQDRFARARRRHLNGRCFCNEATART